MKYILFLLMAMTGLQTIAQKKLISVTQSEMTGVRLPPGSKQDKRMLMEAAGQILLEMESKKFGTGIANTEVLTLPALAVSGFSSDSLVAQLTSLGWNITPDEKDNKYVWLQKDNRFVLAYFSTDKRETSLYFGLAANPPALTAGVRSFETSQQLVSNIKKQ